MTDLPRLRALAEAATPGPWIVVEDDTYGRGAICYGIVRPMPDGRDETIVETDAGAYPPDPATARLIAESRTAIPALLDRVEELQRECERLRGAYSKLAMQQVTPLVRAGYECATEHASIFFDVQATYIDWDESDKALAELLSKLGVDDSQIAPKGRR